MTCAERFWAKVDTSAGMLNCWPWLSTKSGNGYGQFWLAGQYRPAHQVAWEIANGRPFPIGMQTCHTCDSPLCVNPLHLFIGTAADNAADKVAKGRQFRPIGERHHNAKLTWSAVAQIRQMAADGTRQRAIAAEFGIDQSTVSYVVSGRLWRAA